MLDSVSRRKAIGLGLLAAAGTAVAGCGSSEGQSGKGGGAWQYTDARGKHLSLDHRPNRIVAYSGIIGALNDYGVRFVGVYGPHSPVNGKPNPQAGDADYSHLTSVGEQYGDFQIEKLAKLRPDLVLETSFLPGKSFYITEEVLPKVERLAPAVALIDTSPRVKTLDVLRNMTELARSLGGNPDSPEAKQAKQRFDKVSETIRQQARSNPLRAVMISAEKDKFYISHPKEQANAHYLQDLGVKFVDPPYQSKGEVFIEMSWEQANRYPADVVLYDSRPQAMPREELLKIPTFRDMPAVRAGQLAPWNPEIPFSHLQLAKNLEQVADWQRRWKPLRA